MTTATRSIQEIVSVQPTAAKILQRFGIDPYSRVNETLDRVCTELQLSVDQVLEKLEDAETLSSGAAPNDISTLSVSRLIQHIVRIHHQCVRQELPQLVMMARELAGTQAELASELNEVAVFVGDLQAEMLAHIQKEEQVLFPFISQMDQDSILGYRPAHNGSFRSVAQPILIMVQEHESAERIVAKMSGITHGFEPPAWACDAHVALYRELCAFEADLKLHVHLENDVLFPRAIEMEATLKQG